MAAVAYHVAAPAAGETKMLAVMESCMVCRASSAQSVAQLGRADCWNFRLNTR